MLKITRMNKWDVHFKYKDKYFVLKDVDGAYSSVTLYHKKNNGNHWVAIGSLYASVLPFPKLRGGEILNSRENLELLDNLLKNEGMYQFME